jgi:hypothetical protein
VRPPVALLRPRKYEVDGLLVSARPSHLFGVLGSRLPMLGCVGREKRAMASSDSAS